MICPNCGETISLTTVRSVTILDGLQAEIQFTTTPDAEKTKDELKAEKAYYKYYDALYKDTIKEVEKRVSKIDGLLADAE
jgi:hypothetical protein